MATPYSGQLIAEAIEYSIFVQAPLATAYDAFATAQGLDAWFTSGAEVGKTAGGRIVFRWRDWGPDKVTCEDGGPILIADRPRCFSFKWQPDGPGYMTTVTLTFRPSEGGTVVSIREHGYRDTPSGRRRMLECAAGWGEALALAKAFIEHGIGKSPTASA